MDGKKQQKRFWLRSNLYRLYGFPSNKTSIEKAFQWIYNAPPEDWENMLKALEWSVSANTDPNNLELLDRGRELYDFLS